MAVYYGDKLVWSANSGSGSIPIKSHQYLDGFYINNGQTSTTFDITASGLTAVNPDKTVIACAGIATSAYSSYFGSSSFITAKMTSSVDFLATRFDTTSTVQFSCDIIEFEDYVNIQKIETTLQTLSGAGNAITEVNPATTLLYLTHQVNDSNVKNRIVRPYLHNSTTVRARGTDNIGNAILWVVSFV
jgi:hypothetical protein